MKVVLLSECLLSVLAVASLSAVVLCTCITHWLSRGYRPWQQVTLFLPYSCRAPLKEGAETWRQTEQSANEYLKIVFIYLNNQLDLIMSPVYIWKILFKATANIHLCHRHCHFLPANFIFVGVSGDEIHLKSEMTDFMERLSPPAIHRNV